MQKEELVFRSRLEDMARLAWQRQIPVFSDFLNLNEQNIYQSLRPELSYLHQECWGGYETAERQMIAFIPDAFCLSEDLHDRFPILALDIRLPQRFAQPLSHRNYLGSLLHLGVDRSKLGDIIVKESGAIVFCEAKIADFLAQELNRVKHTTVSVTVLTPDMEVWTKTQEMPKTEEIRGSVASVRLDSLIALAFHAQRSAAKEMLEEGRVFVNGRLITSNGAHLKEGDLISVRQMGRFRYLGEGNLSKKGRTYVTVEVFR